MNPILKIDVPVKTVSELNQRCHWAVRNKRRTEQRKAIYYAWKVALASSRRRLLPCTVRLTRRGMKLLDGDNLQGSMKYARDIVAELLGVDDADERISFEYAQETGTGYGVIIEVFQPEAKQ